MIKKILFVLTCFGFGLVTAFAYDDIRSRSSHFKDGTFRNLEGESSKSFWSFMKMRFSTEWPAWPESIEPAIKPSYKIQERVLGSEIHVTHINHSTVLLQTQGLNILTDPIYSERCSPVQLVGPKRVQSTGITFAQLPKIDVVLISHDHYDHLDLQTIQMLFERDQPHFYVGLGVGRHMTQIKNFFEMDWWQSINFETNAEKNEKTSESAPNQTVTKRLTTKLKIHFVPVQHFSGRGLFDRNSTLWGGVFLELPDRKIYFGGDTGYAGHFTATREKLGTPDLALLPIGAYEPRDFMKFAHLNPEDAVQAHLDLGAKTSMGIHYGTFQLTSEPVTEPVERLHKALEKNLLDKKSFITPAFGETIILGENLL